jgi:outer membrane protein
MRHCIKIITIALLIVVPTLTSAQKSYKFGHLSSEDILKSLPDMDSVQIKMQKYYKELQEGLEIMQVELNKKLDEYNKGKDAFVDLVRQSKEKELQTMQQNIQEFQDNATPKMQQRQGDLMQPVREKVKKAISDVGKEQGLIYIFDIANGSVAYFSTDSQDVTELVKQKLNIKGTKPAAATTAPKK